MKKERCRSVRHAFGMHRVNKRKVIRMFCRLSKQIGGETSRLTVSSVLPHWLHDAFGGPTLACISNLTRIVKRHFLAVVLVERRFVIVRIDVTWAALHKQKDNPLGSGEKMWLLGGGRLLGLGRASTQTG